MILSHVRTLQNEVKSCNLHAEDTHICTSFIYIGKLDWTTILHSMQTCIQNDFQIPKESSTVVKDGQPSPAAVEGEGRIVLYEGKGWKIWVGSGEKGILMLPDLLRKGYIYF